MKIKKGKCFPIYVSSKVSNEVIDFLSRQNNVSETIFTIIADYINKLKSNDLDSLAKRVSKLEELVHGNKNNYMNQKPAISYDSNVNETTDEDNVDIETLFKQLNDC